MASPVKARKFPWHLILIFSFLSLGILGIGYFYFSYEQAYLKQEKLKELMAIADLKVMQILDWRKERLADAIPIMNDSLFAARVQDWLKGSVKFDLQNEVLQRLKALLISQYQDIVLLDPQGDFLLSVSEEEKSLDFYAKTLAVEAMRTRKPLFSDFYRADGSQAVRLSLLVPILLPRGVGEVSVGAVLMQVDPHQFLYPLIQSWPTPSNSGETLLVRREGNEVVILNETRNRQGTALTLRYPLNGAELPVAKAAKGQVGTIEGLDYRGVPVVAVIGRIPDSPWYFVIKTDAKEIYAPLRARLNSVLFFLILLIIVAGGSLATIWYIQQSRFYHRLYEIELERERALQKLNSELMQYAVLVKDLYNNAPCGYHSLDADGTFVRINETELAWLGYSRDEVVGKMRFSDLLTEESRKTFQDNFAVFKERGWVRGLEISLIRKDGTVVPVLLSATAIKNDSGNYLTSRATLFDITERLRAEKALKESEERLRYLAAQLLKVQEQERARVSMELHDDLGQSLLVLRMQLNAILRRFSHDAPVRQGLEEAAEYLREVIDKVRRLSHALSPIELENLGLTQAIRSLLEEFQRYQNIAVEAELDDVDDLLSKEAHIGIYRIFQEFLSNVHKHAQATAVNVAIKALSDNVAVTLGDNGKGFVLEEGHGRLHNKGGLGLISMAERVRILGGQLSLNSQVGQGTHLFFKISRTSEKKVLESPKAQA